MIIAAAHKFDFSKTADRFIAMLQQLDGVSLGFACDQLHHALMTATLARRAGATDEQIERRWSILLLYASISLFCDGNSLWQTLELCDAL